MILSVSCISVGINRNEIDIINAISWTGKRTFFKGCNKCFQVHLLFQLVSWLMLTDEVIKIKKKNRKEIKIPCLTPSS